jgi:excisionase family DNA binding protein
VAEVAELLGISRASAYTYVRTGQIPSVTLGSRIIVPRKALDELLHGEAA